MIALIIIGIILIVGGFSIPTFMAKSYSKGDEYEKDTAKFLTRLRWMISIPLTVYWSSSS